MGFYSNTQHQAAVIYYAQVFQSSLPTCSTVYRSVLQRKKIGARCNVTATEHSQGAEARKSIFKKPTWLLPVEEIANNSPEDGVQKKALFQVILTTSKDYGSGISDLNAGILLAFIGEDGRCFVYRLSNVLSPNMCETSEQSLEWCEGGHTLHRFQRGAQDVVTLYGPDLGKLEAVWVAPEQGTWRIQDMTLRVFRETLNGANGAITEDTGGKVLQYNFGCEEVLIGENETTAAAELRVSSVSEISKEELLLLDSAKLVGGSQISMGQVRDEGLKEYEALKLSLLSYDACLVIVGSALAAVAGRQDISEGYLIGGILGLFYLFLLESAVDQLPAPSSAQLSSSNNETSSVTSQRETSSSSNTTAEGTHFQLAETSRGFRAPLTRLAGILALFVLIVTALNSANAHTISKEMLFAGAAGFLMTKFATILASNMPLPLKQQADSSREED